MVVEDLSVPSFWRRRISLYRLEAGRCKKCGRIHYPPSAACPYCGSRDIERVRLESEGTLESYTILYSVPEKSRHRAPVILGVINIDGVKIVSELTDADPDDLRVGMKVEAVLRRMDEGGNTGIIRYALKFRPSMVSKGERQ